MIGAVGLYVLVRFLLENFQSTDLHEVKLHGGQLSLRNVKTFISAKTAAVRLSCPCVLRRDAWKARHGKVIGHRVP
jgi:hypothetical protein